jgi:HKD family nuclease
MKFAVSGLGTTLRTELASASAAIVAVAYFNPDDTTLTALARLPNFRLVVSDDFQINDPHKLEHLAQNAMIRAAPSDASEGKLHSKVFLVRRQDGTRWAMVGSANLTWQGLFSNQEACIILDSVESTDDSHLNDVEAWFERIISEAHQIDFEVAKRIFHTRARYRFQRPDLHPLSTEEPTGSRRYWALKTTTGAYGGQHWSDFLAEDVIAIGWRGLGLNPSVASDGELRQAVRRAYPDRGANRAVKKIRRFIELRVGDLVLVCRGYPPNSTADVHIYGVARVAGPFVDDSASSWWRFKHPAVIQVIDQKMPRHIVARGLNRDSLMETIHELEPGSFKDLVKALREILGVTVNL